MYSNRTPDLATQVWGLFCHSPRRAVCGKLAWSICRSTFPYYQSYGSVSTSHLTFIAYLGTRYGAFSFIMFGLLQRGCVTGR